MAATIDPVELSRAAWRKALRSTNNGGACVEVAMLASVIGIRDSKLPTDGEFPTLEIPSTEWAGLLLAVRPDEQSG